MTEALHLTLCNPDSLPEQANRAMKAQLIPYCKQAWANGAERLAVTVMPEEDARSIQQNRYYWGVVLKETAEQARIDGQRYTADAWHELGKRQFLPRVVRKVRVAGKARQIVTTSIGTTTGLSVRKMSQYLEQFTAFAVTDFGVQFSVRDWQEYRT